MQIYLQKSKVYLIFYVFLSKILSIFAINTTHGRLSHRAARVYKSQISNMKLVSLNLLSLQGIYLLPAEDEDLAVTENLCTLYLVGL